MPAKKKTKVTRSAKSTTSRTSSGSLPSLNKSFLDAEQRAFHKQHPNAHTLISIFIAAFVVLTVMYLFKMYA